MLERGTPYPLGATFDGDGVNFALFSENATAVELCLFDETGLIETSRLPMLEFSHGIWHGYLPDAKPGLVYGYRVSGPYSPHAGQRFNPKKVLLDPYAKAVVGQFVDSPLYHGYRADNPDLACPEDNTSVALKGQVVSEAYDWADDEAPRVPWSKTIIYEAHVRGLTQLHPDIPAELRGSYAGLVHPVMLAHYKKLGITAIELLPVHFHVDEPRLLQLGLQNYWGYNSINFFAPDASYWSKRAGTTPLSEFRDMVKALHAVGLEVILDVVFNHTAEQDEIGPTLSYRGIDNASYYVLNPGQPALYENWTGCGNVLNVSHPRVLQMVMDSLRYWVNECHVDGFRFDLAPIAGRLDGRFTPQAPFFAAIAQDPHLSQVKMIAEPWDIGSGGYQVGHFPLGWAEWNDQYRDVMRKFWLHDGVNRALFARRFAASSDIFHKQRRAPKSSINFITAHDGFNLRDLVSYNRKHNLANKEHNRDGHNHNHSWNCGVEGPSEDEGVLLLRLRATKALLATLLLSQGTPMLLAGDELGHTQQGNNNAYCQNNEITWLNWSQANQDLIDYVAELSAIRRECSVLQNSRWWTGVPDEDDILDVEWLNPSGAPLHAHDWEDAAGRALMVCLAKNLLILMNASAHQIHFHLPAGAWVLRLASTGDTQSDFSGKDCRVAARSVTILQRDLNQNQG
ncbi:MULTISPECIES: glycogen debranching protein GlgX [Deefgea]|uniref:Glycogen debranching protein GlgX n=1 Tax=Deefgea chitinilytica TaxID=570276 RepID=A0ABS2CBC1_9NEIS|nr:MULTISPECIES: glycogen debranching protein GlgX [Deefgea]MBM5571445.1 glycogen debranching protein GlgX [Deefgea chitinilytica]MBM9888678.1 glycogen debranching protein GlgX [Deefgea sp. CFH1-16]